MGHFVPSPRAFVCTRHTNVASCSFGSDIGEDSLNGIYHVIDEDSLKWIISWHLRGRLCVPAHTNVASCSFGSDIGEDSLNGTYLQHLIGNLIPKLVSMQKSAGNLIPKQVSMQYLIGNLIPKLVSIQNLAGNLIPNQVPVFVKIHTMAHIVASP